MRLKELRENRKLKQIDVANYLGISYATYSGYETNTHKPTPDTICKLADYFNVTTDYLLGRTSDSLLVNSYIPKSDIQELYDQLSESEKRMVKSYIQGILDTSKNIKKNVTLK